MTLPVFAAASAFASVVVVVDMVVTAVSSAQRIFVLRQPGAQTVMLPSFELACSVLPRRDRYHRPAGQPALLVVVLSPLSISLLALVYL